MKTWPWPLLPEPRHIGSARAVQAYEVRVVLKAASHCRTSARHSRSFKTSVDEDSAPGIARGSAVCGFDVALDATVHSDLAEPKLLISTGRSLARHSIEYEGVVNKLRCRELSRGDHELVRINPLTDRGRNRRIGGCVGPHSSATRD